MSEIETQLRHSYASDPPPTPDAARLLAGARRRGRAIRRRRRALAAAGTVAAGAAAAVVAHAATTAGPGRDPPSVPPPVPVPAGPSLAVFRYSTGVGATRIVSFLDTDGRWCVGAAPGATYRLAAGGYRCADSGLVAAGTGFGRVATTMDAFDYDGVSRWMQGVAAADVARVEVVLADGSTRTARVVDDAAGVVFSVRVPLLSGPRFYRAYDASGLLVQQLRVPQSLPHDPFVD